MPNTLFVFKGIKPKRLNVDSFRKQVLNELRAEGKVQQKELNKTTSSWKGEKPKFESLIGLTRTGGDASVLTGPTGSTLGVNKFNWLNSGTKRRWALMSGNWKSKTKRGKFRSGSGRGQVIIAGRGAMRRRGIGVRPGIEARNWTSTLQKRRTRPFKRRIEKAMKVASDRAF